MSDPGTGRPVPAADQARLDALARRVNDSIVALRPEEGAAALEELLRAFPDHPKIQQIAVCAAVIGFAWPLERGPYAARSAERPSAADLDLVFFHADRPTAASGFHDPIDYMGVLALSLESAMITAPQARRILLTDEATPVPDTLPVHEVRRFPLDVALLMYERMRVQEAYLRDRPTGRCSVLMDSDIVVNREPSVVFGEGFDVALTWRPMYIDAPFNGGVMFVARGEAGASFFRRTLACYDALAADRLVTSRFPRDLRGWWGDQYALAVTAGYREIAAYHASGVCVDGVAVRFLPCSEYNYTPTPGPNREAGSLHSKYFVHFKGNRKDGQEHYLRQMRKRFRRRT